MGKSRRANKRSDDTKADLKVVAAKSTKAIAKPVTKKSAKPKKKELNEHPIIKLNEGGLNKVDQNSNSGHKYLGCHVSAQGGVYNAVTNAALIGCRSFGLFLRPQRTWKITEMPEETVVRFKEEMQKHDFCFSKVLPHGSYLLNLGSPNNDTLEKSRAMLLDELQRCERLGIQMYNFHPGSTCGEITIEECLSRIAESINYVHSKTHEVITVVENMSCQGNTVGGKFEELRAIIDATNDKSRIGICLDTCHLFAAGFNIADEVGYEDTFKQFDDLVGFKYLKAMHLNDSKFGCGSHADRHAYIGKGELKIATFDRIMNDSRFDNIPMVLETPEGLYEEEIKLLKTLIKT